MDFIAVAATNASHWLFASSVIPMILSPSVSKRNGTKEIKKWESRAERRWVFCYSREQSAHHPRGYVSWEIDEPRAATRARNSKHYASVRVVLATFSFVHQLSDFPNASRGWNCTKVWLFIELFRVKYEFHSRHCNCSVCCTMDFYLGFRSFRKPLVSCRSRECLFFLFSLFPFIPKIWETVYKKKGFYSFKIKVYLGVYKRDS